MLPKQSYRLKISVRKLLCLLGLLVFVGCATTGPSEDTSKTVITGYFSAVAGVLEILETGKFNKDKKCCPVKARVLQGYTFRHKGERVFEYCFHKNDEGNWIVRRNEDEKPLPNENEKPPIQVTLTWQYSSSNELGFKIERKTGLGGTYREIATVASYTDTGLRGMGVKSLVLTNGRQTKATNMNAVDRVDTSFFFPTASKADSSGVGLPLVSIPSRNLYQFERWQNLRALLGVTVCKRDFFRSPKETTTFSWKSGCLER